MATLGRDSRNDGPIAPASLGAGLSLRRTTGNYSALGESLAQTWNQRFMLRSINGAAALPYFFNPNQVSTTAETTASRRPMPALPKLSANQDPKRR